LHPKPVSRQQPSIRVGDVQIYRKTEKAGIPLVWPMRNAGSPRSGKSVKLEALASTEN